MYFLILNPPLPHYVSKNPRHAISDPNVITVLTEHSRLSNKS